MVSIAFEYAKEEGLEMRKNWGGGVNMELWGYTTIEPISIYTTSPSHYQYVGVMGCGAAEAICPGFVCFVVLSSLVFLANRDDLGFFFFVSLIVHFWNFRLFGSWSVPLHQYSSSKFPSFYFFHKFSFFYSPPPPPRKRKSLLRRISASSWRRNFP